jgi:hypothetical protein
MTAAVTVSRPLAGTNCPWWCDPTRCLVPADIHPTFPAEVWHGSTDETFVVGDISIRLHTVRLDEPPNSGWHKEHIIFMDCTCPTRKHRGGDVAMTVAQATELIRRLQFQVDMAGE